MQKTELENEIETKSEELASQRERYEVLETVVTQTKEEKTGMQTDLDKLQVTQRHFSSIILTHKL